MGRRARQKAEAERLGIALAVTLLVFATATTALLIYHLGLL